MIIVDGNFGEGGGQMVRTALTMSLMTGQPFSMINIRAKRPQPGLRPQHVAAIKAAKAISGAEITGAVPGSEEISFKPGAIQPGNYQFNIGTAGSVSLVFQTTLIPLALCNSSSKITIKGGTHVPWSPCFHYLEKVFLPAIYTMGIHCHINLKRWGFYPKGDGIMTAEISPSIPEYPFIPGAITNSRRKFSVSGISVVSRLPLSIAKRQAEAAKRIFQPRNIECSIELQEVNARDPGTLLFLYADQGFFCGTTAYGKKGKPAEQVGKEAAEQMTKFLDSRVEVDKYLSDQLLIPVAWAPIGSRWSTNVISSHFTTNIMVINQFRPMNIAIKRRRDGNWEIVHENPGCSAC